MRDIYLFSVQMHHKFTVAISINYATHSENLSVLYWTLSYLQLSLYIRQVKTKWSLTSSTANWWKSDLHFLLVNSNLRVQDSIMILRWVFHVRGVATGSATSIFLTCCQLRINSLILEVPACKVRTLSSMCDTTENSWLTNTKSEQDWYYLKQMDSN